MTRAKDRGEIVNLKEAREILKPFEMYKVFPLTWMKTGENGEPSAMATAEAYGYMQCYEQTRPLIEALEKYLKEKENPVPDAVYARTLLSHVKELFAKYKASVGEGQNG